ncbi:TonB-dependent receptor [Flavobacteriaceae bacterium]|nr:TonB-dependent receptor [Flavobacteriaceae bacterium]
MMKLKVFSLLFALFTTTLFSQKLVKGMVVYTDDSESQLKIKIYEKKIGFITETKVNEIFEFELYQSNAELIFVSDGFPSVNKLIDLKAQDNPFIRIELKAEELSEVILSAKRKEVFLLKRMDDFEQTEIYAGKKNEVILVEQSMGNLASNNSRQIFNQIPGLNIYQNDDAGLQLNVGGRGLDPNRTSNFNTRQNGYDISADVLGYPESYYTPPAEGLEEIQVIRGAASLQYGTQFGGLINFKLKKPDPLKPFTFTSRNTVGSNNLFTNFSMASGTLNKFKYIGFVNLKQGDGFRSNSEFNSSNIFFQVGYDFSDQTSITAEITYLDYLSQQGGGLSDSMFKENPYQSNRSRNWFALSWLLYNLKFQHSFSSDSNLSLNLFGLDAQRNAIGFRSNRVNQIDPNQERDLIKGDFNNIGVELRWLKRYEIGGINSVFLIGGKYYNSDNSSQQGPGSSGSNADFRLLLNEFPDYNQQSAYNYPNQNLALFTEHIFYVLPELSVTPGIRFEFIETGAFGEYKKINTDAAGNVILNKTIVTSEKRRRDFALFGLGIGYKPYKELEFYGNVSENYRSVTFTDISIINPAYIINPEISDEKGFTTDFGIRGRFKKSFSFDANLFRIFYNDRIGFIQKRFNDGSVKAERGNVGDAVLYGLESLLDFNIKEITKLKNTNFLLNYFINFSLINSEYTASSTPGVEGKEVEFVPKINLKTGFKIGYENYSFNVQYSYLSAQFSDSSNALEGNLSGVIGLIPAYDVLDLSSSYSRGRFRFEFGINNALNESYFTRRATGYPGPGIIPSSNRNLYLTIQFKI